MISKRYLGKVKQYKIYLVNGKQIRNLSQIGQEFGLSSSYVYFPDLIPKNEIWIENNVKIQERNILIKDEILKLKLIDRGMDIWDAYHEGERKEKIGRKVSAKLDDNFYVEKYCRIEPEKIDVWLVDAEKIRNIFKTDFMEGGHGYVYYWIPKNEIWIENGIDDEEIPLIILHEFIELVLMQLGNSYDASHEIAARVEWGKRPKNWNKKDVENLTKVEALKLVR